MVSPENTLYHLSEITILHETAQKAVFSRLSGVFEGFSQNAEKGNCKFEPQKCNSVFEFWFGTLHTHKPLLRREHFSLNTETRFLRGEKALAPFRNEGIFYCPLYVTLSFNSILKSPPLQFYHATCKKASCNGVTSM